MQRLKTIKPPAQAKVKAQARTAKLVLTITKLTTPPEMRTPATVIRAVKAKTKMAKKAKTTKMPKPRRNSKEDDIEDDDGAEPATRSNLTRQDFIIGRQKAKLAKKAKANEAGEGGDNNDEGDEDDDEIAPEDEKLINKVFQKTLPQSLKKHSR
jgi:hypothetical protein